MKVRSLLTQQDVARISPDATALDAAHVMAQRKIGALLVGEDGKTLGIFTERDLMVRVIAADLMPGDVKVADVMTRDLFTTSPDRLIADLRDEMRDRHIRHCPVVEDDRVLMVLSIRDLNRAYIEEQQSEVKAMTAYIHGEELEAIQKEIQRREG